MSDVVRAGLLAALAASLLVAPTAARAMPRTDTDAATDITVTLDGASVSFSLTVGTPHAVVKELQSRPLQVLCASSGGTVPGPLRGDMGTPADFDFTAVGHAVRWPR